MKPRRTQCKALSNKETESSCTLLKSHLASADTPGKKHKMLRSDHVYTFYGHSVCKVCNRLFHECMSWVQLWIIKNASDRAGERDLEVSNDPVKNPDEVYSYLDEERSEHWRLIRVESTKNSTFLLATDGTVYVWGVCLPDDESQSGMFTHPRLMPDFFGTSIVSIACGEEHVLALDEGMYVWSWGSNVHGQLGRKRGLASPHRTHYINQIVRIACGAYNSYAVHQNGSVYAWGDNSGGQLGLYDSEVIWKPTELAEQPWSFAEAESHAKNLFKTKKKRDIVVGNVPLEKVRRKQLENEELKVSLQNMESKLNVLSDIRVKTGHQVLKERHWNMDGCLSALKELKNTTKDRLELEPKSKGAGDKRLALTRQQEDLEQQLKKVREQHSELYEKLKQEPDRETASKLTRTTEQEEDLIKQIEALKSEAKQVTSSDPKVTVIVKDDVDKMIAVRKKYLAEKYFLSLSKNSLFTDVKRILSLNRCLQEVKPEKLMQILDPRTGHRFILKYSTKALKAIDTELSRLIEQLLTESQEAVKHILQVLRHNTQLQLEINFMNKRMADEVNAKSAREAPAQEPPARVARNEQAIKEKLEKYGVTLQGGFKLNSKSNNHRRAPKAVVINLPNK